MADYHSRTHSESTRVLNHRRDVPMPPKKKFSGLGQLAQRYGVDDMMDFRSGNYERSTEQTIDDEFLAYTTANFESSEILDRDIITFWEVGILYSCLHVSINVVPNGNAATGE
jgi:hypothetical protein